MAGKRTQGKPSEAAREASLRERAAERGYALVREGDVWYAEVGDTRYGPLASLDELAEFLPGS